MFNVDEQSIFFLHDLSNFFANILPFYRTPLNVFGIKTIRKTNKFAHTKAISNAQ